MKEFSVQEIYKYIDTNFLCSTSKKSKKNVIKSCPSNKKEKCVKMTRKQYNAFKYLKLVDYKNGSKYCGFMKIEITDYTKESFSFYNYLNKDVLC